ncbi:MAG: glycosyl hydrolase 115 family protein [Bacteroidota bacterium]|nr:glycosyl hydrolase 115 family protein [Bacteroidota bacterium]
MIKSIPFFLFAIFICSTLQANFIFRQNTNISVVFNEKKEPEVVRTAFDLFKTDYSKVFSGNLTIGSKGILYFGTVELNDKAEKFVDKNDILELKKHKEGFLITVKKGNLIVLGSDKRGTAYGILEISRMIGVSPWVWWADSRIDKKESFTLEEGFRMLKYPSVAHRGIFLNDEDWGLMPWSSLTYEPSQKKGQIGPKTHARIFELLLRLRANSFWPAMHSCSVAFYLTPGNKEMADKYGIILGTSHCEPMMRNTNAEWKYAGTGEYNYISNKENVLKFWEERVKLLSGADNIYTLGMRGIHDGPMNGAKTPEEQKNALANILKDQKDILIKNVNPDIEKIPQVFIPYKEVLDAYKMGLEVPDYVTLMWTDDNYGYLRHFPDEKERARKGGNGVYYHASYWGQPHDYLWLATNHPAQIYTQMKLAYDKGIRNLWILNVGDIKPAEYLIELFLDMAWDINAIENNINGLDKHLYTWLQREFGESNAKELLTVMNEYYRLAYIRKPEFMGNTREEEKDPKYRIVSDFPWSTEYIKKRIAQYAAISDKVISMSGTIAAHKRDAWFQLVEYPVRCAAEMNKKQLYGQLARHGLSDWALSDTAFSTIVTLTEKYNTQNNGKWNRMMDYKPRKLPVFNIAARTSVENPLIEEPKPLCVFNGVEYKEFAGIKPIAHGLGYERGAISLPKGTSVIYNFETTGLDSIKIEVALAPNHPVEGTQIRYAVSVNNEPSQVVDFRTEGRSEEWKQNVLTNRAIRETTHAIPLNGMKTLKITAIDEGVILDQVILFTR